MDFIHVGLVSQSETNADRFFGELLGLQKTKKSHLSREINLGLFGVDQDCELVYYGETGLVFEVFIMGFCEPKDRRISHTCIAVDDQAELLTRCRELGFEVREVEKGDKVVVFIADADGNLFEVKQR